jgi:hypothetical protein
MRGRLAIFLTIALMLVILIALNAASYVRVEREVVSEFDPDRSTFNTDATGASALYEFLRQSGYQVSRWGRPPAALLDNPATTTTAAPANFVIIGKTRLDVEAKDAADILRWVARGGRLVIIDRAPEPALLPPAGRWRVSSEIAEYPDAETRPDNVETMTRGTPLIVPAQPTFLVRDVAQVTRSRFAGRLHVYQQEPQKPTIVGVAPAATAANPTPVSDADESDDERLEDDDPPPPKPLATPATGSIVGETPEAASDEDEETASPAPVEHLADGREGAGALLVDYAYGRGRVVVLSDPYIVSNGGLKLSDNLQLATNIVAGAGGQIAFDEYHQGNGATENPVFAYFAGTPVIWLFAQAGVVVLAALWTRGRRFARPLPAPHVDRRSKLEFVASMAELQSRARAYDLAIENIYTRTRRALARYAGLQPNAPRAQLAERVAARSGKDARVLEELLRDCEETIAGAPLSARRAVTLARRLRELERDLGILMRAREIRQAR